MGFDCIAAGPDGTVFTEVEWDESGMEMGYYKNGQDLGQWKQAGTTFANDQWDSNDPDGGAVAANANYAFFTINRTINSPTQGPGWFRCNSRSTNSPVGPDIQASTQELRGLALNGNNLYVSDPGDGLIKIYNITNTSSITLSSSFAFAKPGRLTVDGSGNLWIMDTSASPAVVREYSSTGTNLNKAITFASTALPLDISYNTFTQRLMVADMGSDQNIKFYNPTSISGTPTTVTGTLGTVHGIYSGTDGQRQALKFLNPSSVSSDSSGNIYVAESVPTIPTDSNHTYGASLSSYTPSGTKNWELDNLDFMDSSTADPSNEASVYTKDKHFTLNFANTNPGTEWTYTGHTLDPFTYPQDLRYAGDPDISDVLTMRRINGSLFMFLSNEFSNYCAIYRFNSATHGEIAIPCGLIEEQNTGKSWPPNQPSAGEWIWHDTNGNGNFDAGEFTTNGGANTPGIIFSGSFYNSYGWSVDALGNIWLATIANGIREYPCQGLDSNGSPTYNYTTMTTTAMPAPFTSLYRAIYDQPSDTMYLTGYTAAYPNSYDYWGKCVGRVAAGYKNWSTGNRTASWTINNMPYNINTSVPGQDVYYAAASVVGNYLFLQTSTCGSNTSGNVQTTVIYNTNEIVSGSPVQVGGLLPPPDASLGVAEIDIPFGMQAYQRANGQYIVNVEDDWFGKQLFYRLDAWQDADIGTVGLAGSSSYNTSGNVFTVKGAGNDIWNTSDGFHYVYRNLTGNATVIARVTSETNTNAWAKAGVMIRATLDPGSQHFSEVMTPTTTNGASAQWRVTAGGNSSYTDKAGLALPYWVKVVRSGNSFSGYVSPDGVTWTQDGTTQTVTMPTTVYVGLAVTSTTTTALCTATIDNVSVTTP